MQCPNCNHWNEVGANFCEECGFELKGLDRSSKPVSVKPATLPAKPVAQGETPPPVIPQQSLEPAEPIQDTSPYKGPRLVLNTTGTIFRLGEKVTVGREDPRLDIDFEGYPDGKFVSGKHAQIILMEDRYYIEDLGSSNFTYINNRRLSNGQLEPLKTGDIVRFGKIELTFYDGR